MNIKVIFPLAAFALLIAVSPLFLQSAISPQVAIPATAALAINSNGTVTIIFHGSVGASYRIESCDDLANKEWRIMADNLTAGASGTEWIDLRPLVAAGRFYRVVPAGSTATAADAATLSAEASAANQLLAAINAGDYQTAIELLRQHGISDSTLETLEQNLGRPAARSVLAEGFFRGCVSASLTGRATNVISRFNTAREIGYGRPFWIARSLTGNWTTNYDAELRLSPMPPVGVLDTVVNDAQAIQFFRWYDRYAEQLHSVALNWEHLSNHELKSDFSAANQTMSGLFKLIKARKPDAFVWVGVVKQDDRTDERWLRALNFQPDGLLVWNLRQFHSPFENAYTRLTAIVGPATPLVVAGFYGYKQPLQKAGRQLSEAKRIESSAERGAAKRAAMQQLEAMGDAIGVETLARLEEKLRAIGFQGLAPHWLLVQAVAEAQAQPQTK